MIKYILLFTVVFISSCSPNSDKVSDKGIVMDSLNVKDREKKDSIVIDVHLKSFMDTLKPIFGYRFKIHGDFNADGKIDTLIEHFISRFFNKAY